MRTHRVPKAFLKGDSEQRPVGPELQLLLREACCILVVSLKATVSEGPQVLSSNCNQERNLFLLRATMRATSLGETQVKQLSRRLLLLEVDHVVV